MSIYHSYTLEFTLCVEQSISGQVLLFYEGPKSVQLPSWYMAHCHCHLHCVHLGKYPSCTLEYLMVYSSIILSDSLVTSEIN